MVQAYSPSALNKPDEVVTADEIYVDSRPPSANLYGQLAIYALTAGQTRKAELAEKKALSLATDKAERAQIKQTIAQAKQQIAQDQATAAGSAAGSSTAAVNTSCDATAASVVVHTSRPSDTTTRTSGGGGGASTPGSPLTQALITL